MIEPDRYVEVAVDAAGPAGSRTWTYRVPPELHDLEAGEAVLVDWGRRRAVAVVLGFVDAPGAMDVRPLGERIRADGPLLPPLALELARDIVRHYLAPPAAAIRAMLPPGLLEKVDLVATLLSAATEPADEPGDPAQAALLGALSAGPRPVRDLVGAEGRPAVLRRLRALAAGGIVSLEWMLGAAGASPRFVRLASATPAGLDVAAGRRAIDGRPLGPRQKAVLAELAEAAAAGSAESKAELGPPGPGSTTAPAGSIAVPSLEGRHGSGVIGTLERRGLVSVATHEIRRDPLAARVRSTRGALPSGAALSDSQRRAVIAISTAMGGRDATPLLVDGPTGAGKTAVYVEAIAACFAAGRPALVLVPEIALALPLVDRLRADLGVDVVVVHSGLSDGERADGWRTIRAGLADIIVGTRLAVLSPFRDVGLVIVDEEHDGAYKSDRTPRIQARDLAVTLGRLAGAAVVLGSATPSVEAVGRALDGRWRRATLPERAAGNLPAIELVDLKAELAAGNRGLLSDRLHRLLGDLDRDCHDQAILVINRRGAASAVLCRDCAHVLACGECTRPLVFHQAGMTLRCHHCGSAAPMPARCPACSSPRIRYLGGGTERLEADVRAAFPALRVGRLDRDIVERRGAAARVVDAFAGGALDVLVGTSLVTKGFDIPGVTLVGIVSSDIALTLPDERAAERTFQLIVQAIGRAGRGDRPGRAVIQTYQPDHPVMQAVCSGDADAFYAAELEVRRRFGAPPYGRTVKLTCGLEDQAEARTTARAMVESLRARAESRGSGDVVSGPSEAWIPRRAGRWRYNVVIRGSDPVTLLGDDPGPPWSVDVDPESLL